MERVQLLYIQMPKQTPKLVMTIDKEAITDKGRSD
jgi:hypothetical protein